MAGSLTLALAVLTPATARAGNNAQLDSIELYATINAVGVEASVTEDDPGEEQLWVEYRRAGEPEFAEGHALLPIGQGRYVGSAMFLDAATDYELRVILLEPGDNSTQELSETVTTRAGVPAAPTGIDLWVDAAGGDDGNDGTQGSPLATIQAATELAQPGDTVHVLPGVYRETVTPPTGGTEDNPLWIVAEGEGVIIDGADETIAAGVAWDSEGGALYSTAFAGETLYVAVDDDRIYDYHSLPELQGESMGLPGGFYVDEGAQRLYLALPDGGDPNDRDVFVAVRDAGFLLDTIGHVVIEGFEIRYMGAAQFGGVGVDVRDSHHCWVMDNDIHHMNGGVRIRRALASENVIERNSVRDTSVYGWPWGSVKTFTAEATAISVTHGRGNIVRNNVTEGAFNGIYVGSFGDSDEAIARDTDVYGNLMRQHGDDGIEPEGACVNVRFWNNVIRDVYNAISLAPIEVGPTWVVRTLVDGYQQNTLKLNNGSTGWILVYHTTSAPLDGAQYPGAQAINPSIPFGPLIARNNIWHGNRYVIEYDGTQVFDGVDFDHDNLWTDDVEDAGRFVKWLDVQYPDVAALAASGTIEQSGVQLQPAYDDPEAGDYNLVDGHALVDAALPVPGINTPFVVGDGPDVGAFERGGVAPGPDDSDSSGESESAGTDTTGETGDSDSSTGSTAGPGTAGTDTAATDTAQTGGESTQGGSTGPTSASAGETEGSETGGGGDGCGCTGSGGAGSGDAAPLGVALLLLGSALRRRRAPTGPRERSR